MADKNDKSVLSSIILNTVYVSTWIALSGTVILYNKWILAYYGFDYPITLTMWHMLFSSVLAFACVRGGYVPSINMTMENYCKAILPISALFAGKRLLSIIADWQQLSCTSISCLFLIAQACSLINCRIMRCLPA